MQGYKYPVEVEGNYTPEPNDEQCRTLLRALWHYASAYADHEPNGIREMTINDLMCDLIDSQSNGYGMTRDEWVEIGRATGIPV
jgi:hypothetical protein